MLMIPLNNMDSVAGGTKFSDTKISINYTIISSSFGLGARKEKLRCEK